MNNLKDIHNLWLGLDVCVGLFYQDVNEQFEGYTQRIARAHFHMAGCFIRMSMNNLKDIHNGGKYEPADIVVVLSGCQ